MELLRFCPANGARGQERLQLPLHAEEFGADDFGEGNGEEQAERGNCGLRIVDCGMRIHEINGYSAVQRVRWQWGQK